MSIVLALLAVLHVVAAIATGAHVLFHYRRPAAAALWLITIFAVPLLGSLAYVVLAMFVGSRSIRRQREHGKRLRGDRDGGGGDVDPYPPSFREAGFGAVMRKVCSLPLTAGNAVDLVDDGEALGCQLEAIRGARQHVYLQTYVLNPGAVFDALRDALAGRARDGVDVRLLVDPIGSQETPERDLRLLREDGIDVQTFLQPNPLKGRLQINFRNHRKLLVVDAATGFTGGRNWTDDYFVDTAGERAFRDTTFRMRGPIVGQMIRLFREDWAIALEGGSGVPDGVPVVDAVGDVACRLLPSGPDESRDDPRDVLIAVFRAARRSILIMTPYFVPGQIVFHTLRIAAMSGVRVDLLLPRECHKRSIDLAAQHYFEGLLDAGVRIHRCAEPLLHAKVVVVDDVWSSVGSLNFDHRSFELNYEFNAEVIDEAFARSLRAYFDRERAHAEELDPGLFAKRSIRDRMMENAAVLFEPLM